MRGADLLVQILARAGVERIFSLSGNQIMPIYDACLDARIDIVHTRHEAAAVFMADAWAQLTGQPGVALVTAAPGFGNALGPLFSARASESPVLLISGDAPVGMDGRGAFQELDQTAISAPLVKAAYRPATPEALGRDVAAALRAATSGRPGPVHVAVPFDVVESQIDETPAEQPASGADAVPSAEEVTTLRKALDAARRPLVLTGPSLNRTRAGALLEQLAAALGAPVVAMESPRGLKDPSLGDFAACAGEADLIFCLGKSVDFTLGFGATPPWPEDCDWIVVDCEAQARERAARNLGSRLKHATNADPRAMARALAAKTPPPPDRSGWMARVAGAIAARRMPDEPGDGTITSAMLCAAVHRRVAAVGASVVICDGGEFGQWAQALVSGDARVINGPSGAIGGGLCSALAARQARPEATVFALMGDGTAGFHFAEFETAARERTPFVAVIGNDRCWNAEHQIQLREYGPDRLIGCGLSGARYDLAAAGLGCHGEYVTEAADLDAALERAVASGKPACVNVIIDGLPAPAGSGH